MVRDRARFMRRPAAVSRGLSVRMREQAAAARFGLFARRGRQTARKRGGKGRVILRTAGRELVPEVMTMADERSRIEEQVDEAERRSGESRKRAAEAAEREEAGSSAGNEVGGDAPELEDDESNPPLRQ
jgi:hypothetical protein